MASLAHVCSRERARFLLVPPRLGRCCSASPSPIRPASSPHPPPPTPAPLPLCLARKCCKPQVPAFLGMQQARGMLGFPLCFLRTGLFFHPKPSWSPRELKADLLKSAGRAGGGGRAREGNLRQGGWQIFTQHLRCLRDSPPGGGDGLTQVLGQLLIPPGFT